jgi:hypothetical protein
VRLGGLLQRQQDFRELNTSRRVPTREYFESQGTVSNSCPSACAVCSSHFNCSTCASGNYLKTMECATVSVLRDRCEQSEPGLYAVSDGLPQLLLPERLHGLRCYYLYPDNLCYDSCAVRFYGNAQTSQC